MTDQNRYAFELEAEHVIATFVRENREFTVDRDQPAYRGGTNCIALGSYGPQPVVYKYFRTEDRWRNEWACLAHFEKTGLVPRVLVTQHRLIVMTRLPGSDLDLTGCSPAEVAELSIRFGAALATLAAMPLPVGNATYSPLSDFRVIHWHTDLRTVLLDYLDIARRAPELIELYRQPFYARSLWLVESQVDTIAGHRQMLFHEDVFNARSEGARFIGFYDLEMCRLGTEYMQLGVATRLCGPQMLSWSHMVGGFEASQGKVFDEEDFTAILAMGHFYSLQRVFWGKYPLTPAQRVEAEHDAPGWLADMRHVCAVLKENMDIRRWFPDGDQSA